MIRAIFSIHSQLQQLYKAKYVPEKLALSPDTTHDQNERVIRYFSDYLGRPAEVDDLGKEDLLGYRAWRLEEGRRHKHRKDADAVSPATVNKDVRILRALWSYAFNEDLCANPPKKIAKLREEKHEPEAYSIADIMRFLRACAETAGEVHGLPAGLYWWSYFSGSYDTGLRRTAQLKTRLVDVCIDRSYLNARARVQKQVVQQRKDLHPDTLAAIQRLIAIEPGRELVWPWRHSTTHFYDRVHAILARAKLERAPRKPVHGLRASHATYLYDKFGLDSARQSCGHSSDKVTKDGYIDRTLLTDKRVAASLPRPGAYPGL